MKNKTKDNNILITIITILFKLSLVSLISVMSYYAFDKLSNLNFSCESIVVAIFTTATPIIFTYIDLKEDKEILDNWTLIDYILLVVSIFTVTSYTQETEGIEFYILSIAFVLYTFLGMIIIIYNNTYIITIVILCMVYGSIDNNGYEIFIAVVIYVLSNLNKDDIQNLLNIRYFESKKFIEDKYKAAIAIISTAFTNLIGDKIWIILKTLIKSYIGIDIFTNNYGGIYYYIYIFIKILLKGTFRFIFFMIVYVVIFIFLRNNKSTLKKRYTDIY